MVGCDLQRILADAVFRHRCRSKELCLRSPARRLARPLASATVGVFASAGLGEFRRSGGKRQRRGLRPPPFETTPWGVGDYQIAPKPPGRRLWLVATDAAGHGDDACGRDGGPLIRQPTADTFPPEGRLEGVPFSNTGHSRGKLGGFTAR